MILIQRVFVKKNNTKEKCSLLVTNSTDTKKKSEDQNGLVLQYCFSHWVFMAVVHLGRWGLVSLGVGGIRVNTRCSNNVGLMLSQRLRRWRNINPTLVEPLVFVGIRLCWSVCGRTPISTFDHCHITLVVPGWSAHLVNGVMAAWHAPSLKASSTGTGIWQNYATTLETSV